ncbi:hypothetical protein DL765_001842 [Monosporascus sp. GIB2]|nr:hypothetical protein DL765_001842 [Monosporascus sp. GIB2]
MKRRAVKEKLKQLEECNTRLYGFLEKAGKIQENPSSEDLGSRMSIQFVAPLHIIQENAARVHRRLSRRRRKALRDYSQTAGRKNCFELSFSRGTASSWLDVEFSLDEHSDAVPSVPHVPKVTFAPESSTKEDMGTKLSGAPEITSICSTIRTAAHPLVGFYLDSSDILRGLYQVQSSSRRLMTKHMTMGQLLPHLKQSLRDRYSLAITMASSVLQLGETPWLGQPWCKSDVIFLRLNDQGEQLVDMNHPYLTFVHHAEDIAATERTKQLQRPSQLNMLALGIMLLEIYFGTPLESRKKQAANESDPEPDVGADLLAAHRWMQTQYAAGNLTNAFNKAATFCLQSYLDPSASFGDAKFVQAVEKQVLDPLEREVQMLVHGV